MSSAEFYESVKDSDFCEESSIGNDIIDDLGLSNFFPEKITLNHVRQHDHDKDSNMLIDIKWILISKLIGLNAKARDLKLEPILNRHASKTSTEGSHTDFDDFLDKLIKNDFSDQICKTVTFHPLDIFLAVFSCCSPFLKQLIISKMFTCRLAVPLISIEWINIGSLKLWSWPLRGISIEGMSEDKKTIQISLMKSKLKVVSFIRLGRPSVSKSKLMNEVLTNQYHDTFFNKDCPLGTAAKSISYGLIEASWFLPAQQGSSVFSDVVMFLNLRGDGNDYLQQRKILQQISSIVIIIVESNELSTMKTVETCMQMHTSGVSVLYAVDCNLQETNLKQNIKSFMQQMKEFYKQMTVINITNQKGLSVVKEELRNVIRRTLREKPKTSLEDIMEDIKQPFGVTSDETSSSCTKGKEKTELIMKGIRTKKKKDILPLQNLIWIECTKVMKQQRKASESLKPQQIDKMEQQLKSLRRAQHKKGKELSCAMKLFISTLVELEDSSEEIQYFLCYLKLSLDEMSRFNLPQLIHTYQTKWKKWQSDKGVKDPKTVNALKMEVDKAELELAEAPFGYEHLIRELGQLFECTKKIGPLVDTELTDSIPRCPKLVAKQLLLGQPFEIMDGDAANVPTTWVNAVFQELKNIVGDAKVLSISVLGIQSSGKSTLLNTMFGLQFAVSAGRCTRGVFLQVLPLPTNKYPFEYLLVIDTEGLRAPELSNFKHEHDNEIATFVIGLGDVTIINVKGENAAEVNDVLQIAVHAFLRLQLAAKNSIRLHQSCIFVHQNVPAKDAKEKMMHGRKKFVEHLDIMTKEAAAQENMFHISSFNQVMDFDSEDHVFYFSDLWYGDPPMAPVNQGYSTNVETLDEFLFSDIVSKRQTYLTLSDTRQRMLDLWEGILTDDFVFSFRNTLEVKAYNSVETIFQALKWDLEKHVFNFVFKTSENKYACCQTIEKCETVHDENGRQLKQSIEMEVKGLIVTWQRKLTENPWKEIVVQWKESKISSLKLFADEQKSQALRELKTLKERYILIIKNREGLSQANSQILFKKAKDIADKMQGKQASQHQLNQEFDKMWKSCIEEFNVTQNVEAEPIREQIQKALLEFNSSDAIFLKSISERLRPQDYKTLECLKGCLNSDDMMDEYIGVHLQGSRSLRNTISPDLAKHATLYITDGFLESIDVYINEKKKMNTKFNILYIKEIFQKIESLIQHHNTTRENPFSLLKPYKAMIQLHVSKYAEHAFTRINDRYEEMNGLQKKINDYRKTLWEYFIARVEQRSEEVSLGTQFCKILSKVVISTVSKFLPIDVQSQILEDFAHTKFHLMTRILDSLAEKEDFGEFLFYISHSKQFAEKWIENYSENKIFSLVSPNRMTRYAMLAKRRIDEIFESLQNAIESAETTIAKQMDTSVDKWLDIVTAALNGCIPLSVRNFVHIADQHISDMQSFTAHLISELPKLQQECLHFFLIVNPSNVVWVERNPYTSIAANLWGCQECCPFCLEPCQKSDERHFQVDKTDVHTCIQHRPVGVCGVHYKQTNKMAIKVCNFEVQSNDSFYCSASHYKCRESGKCNSKDTTTNHLCREYKDVLPSWDIAPSNSIHSSNFWSWFVCKYVNQICQRYSIQEPDDIPDSWLVISKKEATESLRKALT